MPAEPAPQPLAGLRVVESTHLVMGPTCGMVLADMGAEVIKVEPIEGEGTRRLLGAGAGFFALFKRSYRTGRPGDPLRAGTSVNGIMGGLFRAIGALGALIQRGITGRGMEVQSALFEHNVFLMGQHMLQFAMTGRHLAPMPARSICGDARTAQIPPSPQPSP